MKTFYMKKDGKETELSRIKSSKDLYNYLSGYNDFVEYDANLVFEQYGYLPDWFVGTGLYDVSFVEPEIVMEPNDEKVSIGLVDYIQFYTKEEETEDRYIHYINF